MEVKKVREYLAHNENDEGKPHLLRDHLRSVGALARNFIEKANSDFASIAEWAGYLHDLGKYKDEFLEYLLGNRNGSKETHHAVYGAALAFQKARKCPAWIPVVFAIAAHHAGLHNKDQLKEMFDKYESDKHLPKITERFERELFAVPDTIEAPSDYFSANLPIEKKLRLEMAIRMVFSCLVDADFLDTERHFLCGKERQSFALSPRALLERLEEERQRKRREAEQKGSSPDLIRLRNQIFDWALEKAQLPQGFFSLTVPTGGGKTIASLAFALKHAEVHNLQRIIVVIPYLSIIEQTAAEYRRILDPNDEGLVIEHHSAVKIDAEDREKEQISESRERSPLVLAAENWDAPIIITTSVQFIESLFANKPSKCRKLHNIARSVVIFDEVQTLPYHLLNPLLSSLRELKETWGTSFVFSTATQPAFRKQNNLENGFSESEVTEITENTSEIFRLLQRVNYIFLKEPMSKDEIAEKLSAHSQVLCVVNTRRQAFEIHEKLAGNIAESEKEFVFHLSSSMCPEHRLEKIMKIKSLLNQGMPCRVVSTQLVEAGVDLDFPVVWRALSPLDSIAQAAGRANREGKLSRGTVYIFSLQDASYPDKVYESATDISSVIMHSRDADELAQNPAIFAEYFSQFFQGVATGGDINKERAQFQFRDVVDKVKVIEAQGLPVIVPFGGEEGKPMKIVRGIRARSSKTEKAWIETKELRTLQRFMVNLNKRDFEFLRNRGQIEPLFEGIDLWVLNIGSYSETYGTLIDKRPTDEILGGI